VGAMKDEQSFVQKIGVITSAVDLVQQIKLLNEYMHDVMHVDNKADFLYWSSGLSGETFRITIAIIRFKRLKAKVDAGADYVTQMF
jgi:methylenetetrahydrofolate reductase (NADPH)